VATIGGVVPRAFTLRGAFFYVKDNGQSERPDRISQVFRQPLPPARCPRPNPDALTFRVREGDIVVQPG
jgi:hypothetical protein